VEIIVALFAGCQCFGTSTIQLTALISRASCYAGEIMHYFGTSFVCVYICGIYRVKALFL
jgi:hypothetical protein